MAVLLIGDNEFNGKIVCDGNVNTECTEFIDYGDGVEVIHLYVSSGFISSSTLQLYERPLDSTGDWISIFEMNMGGYYDYVWQGLTLWGDNTEYKVTYKGLTKYYTLNYPCVPDWQCEIPLNGYEEDGCGNRRENIDCVDPCIGVTCPDYCDYDTHVKYINGICVDGFCVYDTEENSVECGYDPCEGVDCPNVCIGNDLYSQICDPATGKCVTDQLIESDSVSCKVPTDEETIMKYIIFGGLGLIGLAMLKKK